LAHEPASHLFAFIYWTASGFKRGHLRNEKGPVESERDEYRTGGSATGLSATGAWGRAIAGDKQQPT
jgi:hypothetical protein